LLSVGALDLARLRRLHRAAVAAWSLRLAGLVVAPVTYLHGIGQTIYVLEPLDDVCARYYGQHVDETVAFPGGHPQPWSWFPLSHKCNADFDMVSAWVNPLVVISLVVAVLAAAALRVLRRRHHDVAAAAVARAVDEPYDRSAREDA